MKTTIKVVLALSMLGSFTAANAGVVQVWECTLKQGKSENDLMNVSSAWLAAAKSMKGGGEFEVYHEFPLAAEVGPGRFNFVLIAPGAESWGTFMGGYPGSAASKVDEEWNAVAECNGSSLWGSVKVE